METEATRPDTLPPQSIALSAQELATATLTPEHRALAVAILSFRGYVILKSALPPGFMERLGREWREVYDECRAMHDAPETGTSPDSLHQFQVTPRTRATFWFRKFRWRIFPRMTGALADPWLQANPFVAPVLEDLLGPGYYCQYVSSDTCVKGAMLQSPHSDIDQDKVIENGRWQPRGYIVNVPLVECGLHNGPLEVWPGGSHMWSTSLFKQHGLAPDVQDGRNPPVEALAEYFPSVKVTMSPGDILVRDLAMWHRGTPSESDEPRTMLTTAYFREGYQYGYGGLDDSLDRPLFDAMRPDVKRRFAHHFSLEYRLKRANKRLRKIAKSWLRPGK